MTPRHVNLIQLGLAVGAILVSITLAYAALDKHIALVEQKVDFFMKDTERWHENLKQATPTPTVGVAVK